MNELTFIFIIFLAMMSPGPDWALIFQVTTSRGRAAGIAVAFGIASGIACHTLVALLALQAMQISTPGWYEVLRWAGAGYLVYLGWIIWKSAAIGGSENIRSQDRKFESGEALRFFNQGLFCNLTNAKAFLFITTLFTQWNSPENGNNLPPWKLGGILVLETAVVWTLFAWVIGSQGVRAVLLRFRFWMDRILALALWGVALALLISH